MNKLIAFNIWKLYIAILKYGAKVRQTRTFNNGSEIAYAVDTWDGDSVVLFPHFYNLR